MNWIQKKLQSFVEKAKQTFKKNRPSKAEQANSAWVNCPGCNQMKLRFVLRFVCFSRSKPKNNAGLK